MKGRWHVSLEPMSWLLAQWSECNGWSWIIGWTAKIAGFFREIGFHSMLSLAEPKTSKWLFWETLSVIPVDWMLPDSLLDSWLVSNDHYSCLARRVIFKTGTTRIAKTWFIYYQCLSYWVLFWTCVNCWWPSATSWTHYVRRRRIAWKCQNGFTYAKNSDFWKKCSFLRILFGR